MFQDSPTVKAGEGQGQKRNGQETEAPALPQRALHFFGPMIRPHTLGQNVSVALINPGIADDEHSSGTVQGLLHCTALCYSSTDYKHAMEMTRASLSERL